MWNNQARPRSTTPPRAGVAGLDSPHNGTEAMLGVLYLFFAEGNALPYIDEDGCQEKVIVEELDLSLLH